MITKDEIKSVREQIQEDLLCLLDGYPLDLQDRVCQMIVNRMQPLVDKSEDCSLPDFYKQIA